ncbi:MAG: hypothetical protein KAR13_13605 [Desulfobulbaceae bacterium]|nr:hypothetical protein [Desulfobulbaceae bacterium]MCK5322893.1 hypothetical protein [Desulfobulbaceae bacterium]MCK5436932.1 hypothetical protein [Desulfobulbaceae bacterium]
MKKLLFILFICLSTHQLQAGETVIAQGMSFFEPGREAIAREKALDEAKREAIEKAVGVAVESRTVVENFRLSRDQVLTHSSGYLKKLEILEENKTDLGAYMVKIRAEVEISALVEDLDRFKKILGWQKNPRVRVIVEPGIDYKHRSAAVKSANRLAGKLKLDGFRVFMGEEKGDSGMGLLVGIGLELSTSESDYQGLQLSLNEISLTANIYRSGDKEVLATATAVQSVPGSNRLKALDKGGAECVDAVWADMRSQLTRIWEEEFYSQREIDLVVKNVSSHAGALEIADTFKSDVSGVAGAELIRFSNNSAAYGLIYKGWPEHLVNELQMSYFKNRYFDAVLEEISGNRITIRIKK